MQKLEEQTIRSAQSKRARLDLPRTSLSMSERRAEQMRCIMATVREESPSLTAFSDVMAHALAGYRPASFTPLASRGLFTDGFMVPKGHCKTAPHLQRYLKDHGLEVAFPVPA